MLWKVGEMAGHISTLTVPNDLSFLPIVGAYVMAAAAQIGFDDDEVNDVRLAVDEACTHVIETAFEPGEDQDFKIACQRLPGGLRVTVADMGLPFDPGSIEDYDARGALGRDLSGLPYYLMQRLMDDIRFVNKGWEGKELQLTKLLKVPSVETYFSPEELQPHDPNIKPVPPVSYQCRLAGPADATEISRCIYKTYGYTYLSEYVYYPERIVAMNQTGEMVSAVAVSETGEVIGHCALSGVPGDPIMEVSQGVVDPAHRGHGVLKALMALLLGEARRRKMRGLYVRAVTLHPYSQRTSLAYGFRESALLLGFAPRRVQVRRFADDELPQRESLVYAFQPLRADPRSLLFPPPHHASMIGRIYHNLGLERELASPEDARLGSRARSARPTLSTRSTSALGTAMIEVIGYGPGIDQEVKARLRDLCHQETAVVYLRLPLEEPQTAVACQRFEELGFFFSGIEPRSAEGSAADGRASGDLLCLQYLNGPRIDYDLLQIHSAFGRELVQYIRDRDTLA